jgi:carboxymethylenebutenolidase
MAQVPQAPDAGHDPEAPVPDLSRRDFVALSVGGGLVLATGTVEAALGMVETEVTIPMPDGTCDAAFFHPASGSHAGVLVWPDAFDLRPSMRAIGRRLAGEGYAVRAESLLQVARAPV